MSIRMDILGAVAAVALLGAGPTVAQDYAFQGFATSDAMNQMHAAMRDNMMSSGDGSPSSARRAAPRVPAAPSGAVVRTTYRASPAVSTRVRSQFAEFVGRNSGREAEQRVRSVLTNGDPVGSWSGIVRSDGLRSGDVADAMAAYWVMNWVIANQGDNNRTQTLAVRDQVRRSIAGGPIARLDDAGRQEMAEVLMLNFLVQHAAYVDAMQRGDNAMARRLGDAAVTRFRNEMGVDLRQLRLTSAGLTPA